MPTAVAVPLAIALGGASIGGSIIQGEQARKDQSRALRSQQEANRLATSRAAAEQRRTEQEQRRVNRKSPDITSLLDTERAAGRGGAASTLLTNPGSRRPTLARASVLGA